MRINEGGRKNMRKIILYMISMSMAFLVITPGVSSTFYQKETKDIKTTTEGKALIATIYLELDPNSQQVLDIIDNYYSPPQGFLSNIDIVVPDPNDDNGEWFMIAPLIRTLIGDWIGIGPFFDIIEPTETTMVHVKILLGDIHFYPPDEENPEKFVIDGWSPFLSWEY